MYTAKIRMETDTHLVINELINISGCAFTNWLIHMETKKLKTFTPVFRKLR